MASLKAEKPAGSGTQLFGQVKKEAVGAKASDGGSKSAASKPSAKKAAQKPLEPKKKKGKGGKAAGSKQ